MRRADIFITQSLFTCGIALAAIAAVAIPAKAEDGYVLRIDQTAKNSGDVTTYTASIKVWGGLTGLGTTASIGATGAASSLSTSNIGIAARSITVGDIRQFSENTGNVASFNNSIWAGGLSGKGASAIISVTGAVSSVSASGIGSPISLTFDRYTNITQTAINGGNISNSGAISVGRLSGTGVSVGISTVGATSAISFARIR